MAADAWSPVLQHLGPVHAYETVLVVLLAFGPFVVLGLVVTLQRRLRGRPASPAPPPPRRP